MINKIADKLSWKPGWPNVISLGAILCICICPEVSMATSIEETMTTAKTLTTTGKVVGLSAASILGAIGATIRGNIKVAGSIILIGVALGFYLSWVEGGMKFLKAG